MFVTPDCFTKYEELNLNEICRLCRNSKGVMSYIFSSIGIDTTEPLSNRIMRFVNIEMREGDGLPNLICHRCLYHVEKLNKFRLKCEQSDALLRQYISYQMEEESYKNIEQNAHLPTPPEEEMNGLVSEECDIKQEPIEPMVPIKEEPDIENIVMVVDPLNTVDGSDDHESDSSDGDMNCPHCNKRFDRQDRFDRHLQIHSQDGPFPCDYCSVVEKDKASLKLHWRKEHSENKAHMCHACGEAFSRREDLVKHNIRHDKIKPYPCNEPSCNKAFAYRSDLRKHLVIHTGARPYVCTICCKSFTRSTNLNKHYRLHSGRRPFSCNECDKLFASRGDLARHSVIHTGEKPYSCPICMISFNRKDKLLRHEKLHKGERPHTCYECPTSFHRKEELTKHIQFHHYSPQMDDGAIAIAKPNSDNQTENIKVESGELDKPPNEKDSETEDVIISVDPSHWDGANHPCDICYKVFSQPYELMKHKLKHGKSKDFICDVCTKGFHTRRELTRHANIHSDIRPFSCGTCGKAFSRKDKLTRHMKIHVTIIATDPLNTREVPVCKICKKTFSSQLELTRHLCTHSTNKPYQCEFCTSSYCRKDKLVKHIKKTHPQSSSESAIACVEKKITIVT